MKRSMEDNPRTKHIVIWDEVDEEGYWTRGIQEEYSDWQEALARTEHLRKIDWCQNIDMVTMGE
jgi:hypothetical protein